jgi:hypothetical protein
VCALFKTHFSPWIFLFADIDQLTRILLLCGTPEEETLSKITSEEVVFLFSATLGKQLKKIQYENSASTAL